MTELNISKIDIIMLRILDITGPDILQGNGIRCTLWVSGCKHRCKMCQNQWTWGYEQGKIYSKCKEEIKEDLRKYLSKKHYDGLTLSGGDPLGQDTKGLEELKELIDWVKQEFPQKNIWLYTGYNLLDIIHSDNCLQKEILNSCDFVVDGQFEIQNKDISLAFRGSSNQIIWERDKKTNEFFKSELN